DPQIAGDLTDAGVAVGVLDRRRAIDRVDADGPGSGLELRAAAGPVDGDVAVGRRRVERAGVIEADVAHGGLEPALAELSVGGEAAEGRVGGDLGTGGDLDGDVDHLGA